METVCEKCHRVKLRCEEEMIYYQLSPTDTYTTIQHKCRLSDTTFSVGYIDKDEIRGLNILQLIEDYSTACIKFDRLLYRR